MKRVQSTRSTSQSMELTELAGALQQGRIDPFHVEDAFPIDLLHWWCCDCMERHFSRLPEYSHVRQLVILGVRQYIAGQLPSQKLMELYEHHRDTSLESDTRPESTILRVAPSAGALISVAFDAARSKVTKAERKPEQAWALLRLAYLCEVWAACGDRSAWLLLEGRCPLPWEEPAAQESAE